MEQQSNPKCKGLTLASFLILPIQRVPRYELCFRVLFCFGFILLWFDWNIQMVVPSKLKIQKLMSTLHLKNKTKKGVAKKTLELMGKVNEAMNEGIRDFTMRQQVRRIEQRTGSLYLLIYSFLFVLNIRREMGRCGGIDKHINKRKQKQKDGIILVSPSRQYLKEGLLVKVCRKKDQRYLFILFTDLLLYCSENRTGKLSLHQQLPIDRYFTLTDVKNNRKYGDVCFEIHSTVKSFLVYADDVETKKEWVDLLQQCV
ncbi:hypothetical protein RFI_27896 [Reticulomyxa filosa]|uniref:PH domain-containing protein n=1 Tax=Reticulomyxa filosa TaxID=46433 RepID=X6M8Y3_RETFI|nr:hypothetical protein RFI_27896 [Reticulomyxa filosa]|eukprot:ETO09480.1 hypothetical protein RFI_27896 [Reticulomyxa filosa]